jgi:hypothetical protein
VIEARSASGGGRLKVAQESPNPRQDPPSIGGIPLQLESLSTRPLDSANVAVRPLKRQIAGLPPIDEHRIVVHASATTRTICRETGEPHLRVRGDIDVVPSGEAGGFDAESPY